MEVWKDSGSILDEDSLPALLQVWVFFCLRTVLLGHKITALR